MVLLLATLVSAWVGGAGPGLVATALAAVAAGIGWATQASDERVGVGGLLVTVAALVVGGGLASAMRAAVRRVEQDAAATREPGVLDATLLEPDGDGTSGLARYIRGQGASAVLAAIVETSDDAIVGKDLDSIVRSWNRGAERIFGYRADEIIGKSIRTIIPPNRWHEEDDVLSRLRRGQRVDHFETIRMRKDGTEVHVSLAISPIRTADGVVIGASKIARDITAQKRAELAKAEMLERERRARRDMEHASRLKDEFLAMLSHELRTPLNAVMGYTQLLMTGALDGPELTQAYKAIERNTQAQVRLVESLLDLSRILAGKLDLHLETLPVSAVIGLAVESVRPAAIQKRLTVQVRGGTDSRVFGDAVRLQQVFWNLLSNATKFTPEGGRISVRVREVDEVVEVVVEDTGRGIAPSLLPHAFERFTQGGGEGRHARSGLGLGLALVHELVGAHGGTVTAESAGEGQGATFIVRLPAVQVSTAADRTAPANANAQAPSSIPPSELHHVLAQGEAGTGERQSLGGPRLD